jgi:hypothetical protein
MGSVDIGGLCYGNLFRDKLNLYRFKRSLEGRRSLAILTYYRLCRGGVATMPVSGVSESPEKLTTEMPSMLWNLKK